MEVNEECCRNKKPVTATKMYTARNKRGGEWIPKFIEYVDEGKCIGCGLCVRICNLYEMKEVPERQMRVQVKGKEKDFTVRKVAVVTNSSNCLCDCHCHLICPVDGGAMVCRAKSEREIFGKVGVKA